MKILYITSHLDDSGSFFVLKGLFKALRGWGDEVTYVNLKEERDAAKRRRPRARDFPTNGPDERPAPRLAPSPLTRAKLYAHSKFPATKRILFDNLLSLPRHWQVITKSDPDVIVGRNASSVVSCVIALMRGIPYLTHMDGIQEAESQFGVKETMDYRFFASLGRGLFKIFGAPMAVVTEAVKSVLVDGGINPEKITVLNNGVDTSVFRPDVPRHSIAERLEGRTVVGFVGSFKPWHRVEDFMEQISEIVRKNPAIVFVFLGRPRGSEGLADSPSATNVIILDAVPQEEVPSIIACFDIGILPFTAYSCSPLKIYEYMAMGKPTIAPRWPSLKVVIEHGVDGYLFEPHDMHALRSGILRLAGEREKREELGRRARQKMIDSFTWEHCARRFRWACEASVASRKKKGGNLR